MDQRDRELLDKQLHGLTVAPRGGEGVMAVGMLAVFLTGLALGSFFFAYKGAPIQFAANNPAHGAHLGAQIARR
jgi:hypothetical protein